MARERPTTPTILAADWRIVRDAYPDASRDELTALVLRSAELVARADPERDPGAAFARRVAEPAADRVRVALGTARLAELVLAEREANEELTRLRTEVLPALKFHAKDLRATIASLERRVRARGIDPATIVPVVGDDAISVDDYEGPAYETNEDRRRAVAAFFGRAREAEG